MAANTSAPAESVTIENCSVHDFDYAGIYVYGKELSATVNEDNVNASNDSEFYLYGIVEYSAGGTTDNVVTDPGVSISG